MALGQVLSRDPPPGSDAVQACGSRHLHAGADDRIEIPHLHDPTRFEVTGPSGSVTTSDFAFDRVANLDGRGLAVRLARDPVRSSHSVFTTDFLDIVPVIDTLLDFPSW